MMPLRTKRPYAKAFLCASIAFLVGMAVLYAGMGPPSAEGAGEAAGRLAFTAIVPALVTGFMARRAVRPWSMGKIISVFLLTFAILAVVQALGYSNSAAA